MTELFVDSIEFGSFHFWKNTFSLWLMSVNFCENQVIIGSSLHQNAFFSTGICVHGERGRGHHMIFFG